MADPRPPDGSPAKAENNSFKASPTVYHYSILVLFRKITNAKVFRDSKAEEILDNHFRDPQISYVVSSNSDAMNFETITHRACQSLTSGNGIVNTDLSSNM